MINQCPSILARTWVNIAVPVGATCPFSKVIPDRVKTESAVATSGLRKRTIVSPIVSVLAFNIVAWAAAWCC
jgi:hypothetical protein